MNEAINQMAIQDAMLHKAETAAVILIYAAAILAALIYAGWLYYKAHDKDTDFRDEDLPPECIKTCANAGPECINWDDECHLYEPKETRKHYDPRTGEVWSE